LRAADIYSFQLIDSGKFSVFLQRILDFTMENNYKWLPKPFGFEEY
jgi:hypothetical protein